MGLLVRRVKPEYISKETVNFRVRTTATVPWIKKTSQYACVYRFCDIINCFPVDSQNHGLSILYFLQSTCGSPSALILSSTR